MAVDELTYPQPVANRQGPSPSSGALAGAAVPAPPQTRYFPFALRANLANTRSSVSTPRLRGPAVVTGFFFSKGGAATGTVGIGLGKSPVSIREENVADTVALPFTPLGTGLEAVGAASGISPNHTTTIVDMQPSLLMPNARPSLIITEPEFFLVVYTATDGATADIVGYVTVAEQVSPQALANFL